MRKITTFITVIFCFCKISPNTFVAAVTYERCELIAEFLEKYNLPLQDSLGMTCVANSVSELQTTHAQTDVLTNQRVFGMFGISEGSACKFSGPGFCQVTCDKFLDNDISDDLQCLQKILEKTKKRPKVFTDCEEYDWKNFMMDCPNEIKKVNKRDVMNSKYFHLRDFEVIEQSLEDNTKEQKMRINRPGPPANPLPVNDDYNGDEDEEISKQSNKEPDYVTDEPPRPFSRPKKGKKSSSKRNRNGNSSKKRTKTSNTSKFNFMSPSIIKTPILPMDFHVIPGPSVSIPISNLGQPIPDVPIEPPPTLLRPGISSFNTQSREYLPPYATQTDSGGRTKKYDIKLDRPASQITVQVTYA